MLQNGNCRTAIPFYLLFLSTVCNMEIMAEAECSGFLSYWSHITYSEPEHSYFCNGDDMVVVSINGMIQNVKKLYKQ